jgi:hypothetical protein
MLQSIYGFLHLLHRGWYKRKQKNEGAIKNLETRSATLDKRHRTKTSKTEKTAYNTNETSNTDPTNNQKIMKIKKK